MITHLSKHLIKHIITNPHNHKTNIVISTEDIPSNVLYDVSGNIILDKYGNYIITRL